MIWLLLFLLFGCYEFEPQPIPPFVDLNTEVCRYDCVYNPDGIQEGPDTVDPLGYVLIDERPVTETNPLGLK